MKEEKENDGLLQTAKIDKDKQEYKHTQPIRTTFQMRLIRFKKKLTGIAALPSPKTKEEFMCVWPAL